jgi:energy-coupling factor transport system permease protein
MGTVFPLRDFPSLACCALAFLGAARVSRLPLRAVARSCRPVFFLAAFTFVFNAAACLGTMGSVLPALHDGAIAALRLSLLVFFAVLLPLTTTPLELAGGMESFLSPFARFGLPTGEFAMMMSVALRFIPLLMDETDRIVKAQLSRGAALDQGNALRRMIAFFPVIIPLFIIIFRRADELAAAMEARGYRGSAGRTRRRPLLWKKSDTGATIFVALVIACFFSLRVFLI